MDLNACLAYTLRKLVDGQLRALPFPDKSDTKLSSPLEEGWPDGLGENYRGQITLCTCPIISDGSCVIFFTKIVYVPSPGNIAVSER